MEVAVNPVAVKAFLAENAVSLLLPTARFVQQRQRRLCPVDTHANRHMRDGITIAPGAGHVDVGPERRFFYARFVELGGDTNRKPRPFVRPSALP